MGFIGTEPGPSGQEACNSISPGQINNMQNRVASKFFLLNVFVYYHQSQFFEGFTAKMSPGQRK